MTQWNGLRRSPMKPSQSRLKRSAGIRKQSRKRAAVSGDERQLYADVVAEAGRCEMCEYGAAQDAHRISHSSLQDNLMRSRSHIVTTSLCCLFDDHPDCAYEKCGCQCHCP